jgi:hypothetical protein
MLPLAVPTAVPAEQRHPGCTVADYCAARYRCPFAYTESWKTAARYSFRTRRVVHDSQRADMLLALSLQVANFPIAGHPYCAPWEDVRLKAAAWDDASVEGV